MSEVLTQLLAAFPRPHAAAGSDYLTVLVAKDAVNKVFTRRGNGAIDKASGRPISEAVAITVHVSDMATMEKVQRLVSKSPNAVLLHGFFPGTEDGRPFTVLSRGRMAEELGLPTTQGRDGSRQPRPEDLDRIDQLHDIDGRIVTVRSAKTTAPSSWLMLDRDVKDDTPAELRRIIQNDDEWFAAMEKVLPGIGTAGSITVPSATGRVVVDGKPLAAAGRHTWIQIAPGFKDRDQLQSFGNQLFLAAFAKGYGYVTRSAAGVALPRTIFDQATFASERLVYDGAPVVRAEE